MAMQAFGEGFLLRFLLSAGLCFLANRVQGLCELFFLPLSGRVNQPGIDGRLLYMPLGVPPSPSPSQLNLPGCPNDGIRTAGCCNHPCTAFPSSLFSISGNGIFPRQLPGLTHRT